MSEVFHPGQPVSGRRRYTSAPFPPYSYVSGFHPHPASDAAGHQFRESRDTPAALDPLRWWESATYLYAVDLFNHGYYWEAHEAWESLWHAAGRRGATADWLKGLIKLAALAVKIREGNASGARRHAQRAGELLAVACPCGGKYAGLDTDSIREFLHRQSIDSMPLTADPHKLLPLVLQPEHKPA